MNGQDFMHVVNEALAPSLTGLGLSMDPPSISGRLYRASFSGSRHSVWISFEPGDNAFFILVFTREHGKWSDIDDRSKTPRLSDLNHRYLQMASEVERTALDTELQFITPRDDEEATLLKLSKELRLVLPRYLADRS